MKGEKKCENKRYPCTHPLCESTFPRPSKLALHMQIHEGKMPFQCDIEGCEKGYTTKAHLKRHRDTQHDKIRVDTKIKCTKQGCTLEFSNSSNMQRHIVRVHNRVYEYRCNVCDQGFSKKKQLHQHSYLHTGDYYYKCDVCDQGFNTLSDCNRHKNTHKLYQCEHCSDEFVLWSDLRKHRVIHKPVLRCTECHYKTKKKIHLDAHLNTHFAPGSRKRFRCTYDCKRHYLYEKNLQFHIRTFHKGIKRQKFQCTAEGCTATLSNISCLKKHLVVKHSTLSTINFVKPRRLRKDCGVPKKKVAETLIGFKIEASSAVEATSIQGISEESKKCQEVLQTDENQLNRINIISSVKFL